MAAEINIKKNCRNYNKGAIYQCKNILFNIEVAKQFIFSTSTKVLEINILDNIRKVESLSVKKRN